jgi:hypothetical protein
VKDGHRIITVTMHSSTGTNRYYDSIKLIKYGFNYIDGYLSRGYRYVSPTDCKIYVDGVEADIAGYMIDDNNYFRLRDLAAMLSGTDSTFQVTYDESSDAVNITTGEEYTALGTELQPIRDAKAFAIKNSPLLYANGESVSLSTYLIDDNNYVKLRDVAAITGFDVQWDEATNSVIITSTANENEDENTGSNPEPVLFMYETTAAVTAP